MRLEAQLPPLAESFQYRVPRFHQVPISAVKMPKAVAGSQGTSTLAVAVLMAGPPFLC